MIDLHIHSRFSDGTDSIENIVQKVIEKNLTHFSITDHDMIDGVSQLLEDALLMDLLKKFGIKFISGVEFSGYIGDNKIHLLGYNFDVNNKSIQEVVEIGRARRYAKYLIRLDALAQQKGILFSEQSLQEMASIEYIGNPIMSNYLVKDGIFANRNDAMKCIKSLKLPDSEINIDAHIILPAIIGAGGISVWAHPLGGLNEPRISIAEVEDVIQQLIPLGLRGLECYYNLYTQEEVDALVNLAEKYNLLISAGSDYHGRNKDADIGEVVDCHEFDATSVATILNEI